MNGYRELWTDRYHSKKRLIEFLKDRLYPHEIIKVEKEIELVSLRDPISDHFFKVCITPNRDIYLQTISQKLILVGGKN